VIPPKKGEANPERAIMAASTWMDSILDGTQPTGLSDPDDLLILRQFFGLLADWDEALKGEIEHE
jgi:hypothetical protein